MYESIKKCEDILSFLFLVLRWSSQILAVKIDEMLSELQK